MLTSSYVIPEMVEQQKKIEDAGIMVFNEIGFDPGIDHMLTKQCVDEVHEKGGKVYFVHLLPDSLTSLYRSCHTCHGVLACQYLKQPMFH